MRKLVTALVCLIITSLGRPQQTSKRSHANFEPSSIRSPLFFSSSAEPLQARSKKQNATITSVKALAGLLRSFNLHHTSQRSSDTWRTSQLNSRVRSDESLMKDAVGAQEEDDEAPLLQLLEEKRLGMLIKRASKDPGAAFEFIQDAGVAGLVSAVIVYIIFYLVAALIGEVIYHTSSGQWFDPRVLLQGDTVGKAEALALIGAWYLICKPLAPLRFAAALLLTPNVKRLIDPSDATSQEDTSASALSNSVQAENLGAASSNQELLSTSSEDSVVECLVHPLTGQSVTLIGTMHLSASSNARVARELRSVKPDVVVLELDPARLPRLGVSDADFAVPYRTSEGIVPPLSEDDIADAELKAAGDGWWWRPVRARAIKVIGRTARLFISNMYKNVGAKVGGGLQAGGEFLEAIVAAKELGVPCVLADRESVDTLTRAAELVLRSEDALSIADRMMSISEEAYINVTALMGGNTNDEDTESVESLLAVMEEMKRNPDLRENFVGRLSADVPEFARAFIDERDYIMAEAINRELDRPGSVRHVCVVAGAGHLGGLRRNLENMWPPSVVEVRDFC